MSDKTPNQAPDIIARLARQLVELALPFVFTPEWRAFILERRLEGASRDELIAAIVKKGVPDALAIQALQYHEREFPKSLLATMRASRAPARDARQDARVEQVVSLKRELHALSLEVVPRQPTPSARDFYENHYCANRPIVMEDFAREWPALEQWKLPSLKKKLGAHEVLVTRGREADPECDVNFEELTVSSTLGDFIDSILALKGAPSNDLYMIANNRNAEDPEILDALLADVILPDGFLTKDGFHGSMSWWVGPAGTLTPMHHDTSNIIFCQIVGKKRFTMVSPLHTEMLRNTRNTYYCELRAEHLREHDIPHHVVELEPGNALFIPVGWWHEVEAIEPSVNISFLNFERHNYFSWYTPGQQ